MVQAGAAGENLYALSLQGLQILQRRGPLAGEGGASIVKEQGLRQGIQLCQRIDLPLHQKSSKLRISLAHGG